MSRHRLRGEDRELELMRELLRYTVSYNDLGLAIDAVKARYPEWETIERLAYEYGDEIVAFLDDFEDLVNRKSREILRHEF